MISSYLAERRAAINLFQKLTFPSKKVTKRSPGNYTPYIIKKDTMNPFSSREKYFGRHPEHKKKGTKKPESDSGKAEKGPKKLCPHCRQGGVETQFVPTPHSSSAKKTCYHLIFTNHLDRDGRARCKGSKEDVQCLTEVSKQKLVPRIGLKEKSPDRKK